MVALGLSLDGIKIMKILLVEDNKSYASTLRDQIVSLPTSPQVDIAESRDSAMELLVACFFDIVILDLEIPTVDGAFDLEVEHGQEVFYCARNFAPGTPVYILTGSEPDAFLRGLARQGQSFDLWGDGVAVPTVDYYLKEDGVQLLEKIQNIATRLAATDAIRINTGGQNIDLKPEQKRALKVFTRVNGGSSCKIKKLGGLSDAVVLKVSVMDAAGHVRCECVGKLGLARHVEKEITAYNSEVKHLRLGAFAPVLSYHDQGLRGFSGIFYALADEYKETFFDLVSSSPEAAKDVLERIKEALERWSNVKQVKLVSVKEIRQRVLSDEHFNNIVQKYSLQRLISLESREVEISSSCIHGDLHGGNVLVNPDGVPVLIDFGDVGSGFSCLDPLTLELSLLFHPDAITCGLASHLEPVVANWLDLDVYARDNPLAPVLKFCRDWAYELGPHDESVLVMAYLFVLRQLKYDTVAPDKIFALLEGILTKLDA